MKSRCTGSNSGRHIFRPFHQEYIDRVKAYHETEAYSKAMRKRGVWVEPLFGEAKQFHRLRRFRLRGLIKVNVEGIMIAAGQNLKRLLKRKAQGNSENPPKNAQSRSARFFFVLEHVMKTLADFILGRLFQQAALIVRRES